MKRFKETLSTLKNTSTSLPCPSAIDIQTPLKLPTYCSQVLHSYDPSSCNYKNYFQEFFYLMILFWIFNLENINTLKICTSKCTLLVRTQRLVFSQLFKDKYTFLMQKKFHLRPNNTPNLVRRDFCFPFRLFKTAFTKLHEHCYTGIETTYKTF